MSFADAMAKVGLISEQDADKARKENLLSQTKQIDKFGRNKDELRKQFQERDKSVVSQQDSRFSKLFNSEKSRKFIVHLLHSFLPVPKGKYVFDWKLQGIKKKNCDICRCETVSKVKVIEIFEKATNSSIGQGKSIFDMFESQNQALRGKKLAVFSPESRTIFCSPCHKEFINWALNESMYHSNPVVNRVMDKNTRLYYRELFDQKDTSVNDYLKNEISKLEKEIDGGN